MTKDFTESALLVYDSSIGKVIDTVSKESKHIGKFFVDRGVIQLAIGMIIATQITTLCPIVIDSIVSPVINTILNKDQNKKLQDYTITLFGIKFKIGSLIIGLINFFVVVLFVFYLWRLMLRINPVLVNPKK